MAEVNRCHDHTDKQEVSRLNSDTEKQQRSGNVSVRQTRFAEAAGKTQAVHESKSESHNPRCAGGNAHVTLPATFLPLTTIENARAVVLLFIAFVKRTDTTG